MTERIGVGLIGANPDHSWAAVSHIPALGFLSSDYVLRAVSTSREESAVEAGRKFGVPAFDNPAALIAHPGVDLVVVSVRTPHHRQLVKAALEAGKHVYCEWPLGNGLAETEELAELARRKGVVAVVGLQARASPVINRVRDLVAQGYVGKVLSTSVVATSWVYGESISPNNAYMLDARNGANLLTIQLGHLADALCYCLGDLEVVRASFATVRKDVQVAGSSRRIQVTTPDQIAVSGLLENGAMASVHLRGGRSRGTNLLWEINGTEGDLRVLGPSSHISTDDSGPLTLEGGRGEDRELAPLPIPDAYRQAPPGVPSGPPFNVARFYVQLASDIRNGTRLCPTFDTAVQRHRLIDAIENAASRAPGAWEAVAASVP